MNQLGNNSQINWLASICFIHSQLAGEKLHIGSIYAIIGCDGLLLHALAYVSITVHLAIIGLCKSLLKATNDGDNLIVVV